MDCCGAGSHKPRQNNNLEELGDSASITKKIVIVGLAVIVIIALIVWIF